jgi:hypothetical protein
MTNQSPMPGVLHTLLKGRPLINPGDDLVDLGPFVGGDALGLYQGGTGLAITAPMEIGHGHADEGVGIVGVQADGTLEALNAPA